MTLNQKLLITAICVAIVALVFFAIFLIRIPKQTKAIKKAVREEIQKAIKGQEEIKKDLTETQKAIILGQSRDAESRLALLALLAGNKKELEPIAEEVGKEIKENQERKKAAIRKVKKDYVPVD